MNITTSRGNVYSYIRRTNEIVGGIVEEQGFEWNFAPCSMFSVMPEVNMFIIGITEQCNLRCTYCCYSGAYGNNRSHSMRKMEVGDIDDIFQFVQCTAEKRPIHIAFYGGEPMMQYPLVKYSVEYGRKLLGDETTFSITTNATLLTPQTMDWLLTNGVEIVISLDGTRSFHDKNRIDIHGNGSYEKIYGVLSCIMESHYHCRDLVSLQMTLASYENITEIAEEWNADPLLRWFAPSNIHGLSANFSIGVKPVVYEEVKDFYEKMISVYEQHQEWSVLRVFLDECMAYWKDRPILDAGTSVPMATCMPLNTKLFVDANMDVGVCEKIADNMRIGNVREGIDWDKANGMVQEYYNRRVNRCKLCPAVRMCEMCLTALEYNDEQWDVLCHNEQVYARVFMFVFCEMVERGLVK